MPYLNQEAPDLKVQAYSNGKIDEFGIKSLAGKWNVILFYPADFTFVCPTELADLNSRLDDFEKAGCRVFSASTDSVYVHKAWADATETIRGLRYPMIGDRNMALTRAFGVLDEAAGVAQRATIILDPELKVRGFEVIDGSVGRNAAEILRRIEALEFVRQHGDNVCPANWHPGAKTLKPSLDLVGKL
ncbi:MAG: peroxiredoxin [Succinivibrio sp.]